MRRATTALLLSAALLPGCACDTVPSDAVTRCEANVVIGEASTDIVFVIDESGSMDEEQQNLQNNLSDFVNALASAPVRNDFRIGVTTTSVTNWDPATPDVYATGPNACAGCAPYAAGALVAIERDGTGAPIPFKLWYDATGWLGARWVNDESPTLVADFEINVRLGTYGSGKEQPLRAIRLALSDRIADGTNAGFLRPGARLAIVILTDEDDCSDSGGNLPTGSSTGQAACHDPAVKFAADQMDSVTDLVSFLRGPIEGETRDPIVAVIAGFDETPPHDPNQCGTSYDAPTRLDALVTALGAENAFKDSICRTDFGPGLQGIADLLVPQTVPIEGAGALPDPRMLAVSITRPDGEVVGCPVAAAGTPEAPSAGAVYTPQAGGSPATLSFQNACVLRQNDRVDVRIVCAV
jgi:hypothetical protein